MRPDSDKRPDPEKLLRRVQAEERFERRGRLKVFLGYSSGVGKSFRMFDEGRRRRERGEDVVIGAIQPKRSADVEKVIEKIETIPLLRVGEQEVIDMDRLLRRHPGVCLVDGLAYDNPPGSRNAKRWQDVEQLLEAGIAVLTSVNLQHIEERRNVVERITGKQVSQTIPESFVRLADEIVIVDVPPELLLQRTQSEEGTARLERRLSELREVALLVAADVVDRQLVAHLEAQGEELWGTQERILVCVTPRANAQKMLESGRRNANRFHGELYCAYVRQPKLTAADQQALDAITATAREMGADVRVLEGQDPIETIMRFARAHGVTQIFIGHSLRESTWTRLAGGAVDKLIDATEGIDVRIFPH